MNLQALTNTIFLSCNFRIGFSIFEEQYNDNINIQRPLQYCNQVLKSTCNEKMVVIKQLYKM